MDKMDNPYLSNPYLDYEIPDARLRQLLVNGLDERELASLPPDLVLGLFNLCKRGLAKNWVLLEENAGLSNSQAEYLTRLTEAEAKKAAIQANLDAMTKKYSEALLSGSILAEELEHVYEVKNSVSRSMYGTKSERRDDEAIILPTDEGDEPISTSDVGESIRFFQVNAAAQKNMEEGNEHPQQATASKSKSKKKAIATDSGATEKSEPEEIAFEDVDPAELYGEAAGKTMDEIYVFLQECRKEMGDGTVRPEGMDDYINKWAKCTEGHFSRMFESCTHRTRIISVLGDILPEGETPEPTIELEGYTFKYVGLKEDHYEVEDIRICLPVVHEMQAMYKLHLNGTERPEEILRAQAALQKYGITVDGAKKAQKELSGSASPGQDSMSCTTDGKDLEHESNLEAESEILESEDSSMSDKDGATTTTDKEEAEEAERNAKERLAEEKREAKRVRERERQQRKAAKKREEAGKPPKSEKTKKPRMETFVHSSKKTIPLIKRSIWSPGLLVLVLCIMFGLIVPGYRLVTAGSFLLGGIKIPVSTMGAMLILIYDKKLKYLLPYFYEDLCSLGYIQADETTLRVLRMQGKSPQAKSYVWIYASMAFSPVQIRIFDFEPGRGGKYCKAMLAAFAGVLLTDAYQGYNLIENVTHAFCFIHFRRKIFDAYESGSSSYVRTRAKMVLDLIDMIFKIEEELQGMGLTPEVLAIERERRMRPLIQNLNRLVKILEEDRHLSKKSKLWTGISYYKNHYFELTYFLKDGHIPMHNQASELEARVVSLHRNNSHFWGSPKGAIAFCAMLSIIETARANNLDLRKYLLFLFENMRGDDFHKDSEFVRSLLPYSERAKKECGSEMPKKTRTVKMKGGKTTA